MRSGCAYLVLLGLLGCGTEEVKLSLAFPHYENAASYILILGNAERMQAQPISQPVRWSLPQDSFSLHLIFYEQSLEELQLEAGAIIPEVPCRSCVLLRPSQIFATELTEGTSSSWLPQDNLPEAFREVLVPDHDPRCGCTTFEATNKRLPSDRVASVIAPIDDRSALVLTEDGAVVRFDTEGNVTELCQRDIWWKTGYRIGEGVYLVPDDSSRVQRLELDRLSPDRPCSDGVSLFAPALTGSKITHIDGPPVANPAEIYAITSTHSFARFSNGRWDLLGTLPPQDNEWGVLWLEAGHAVAFNGGVDTLWATPSGVTTRRLQTKEGMAPMISSAANLAGFGTVFGTTQNLLLFSKPDGGWQLGESKIFVQQRVEDIVSYGDGIAMTIRTGRFRLYYPERGYCEVRDYFHGQSVNHLISLGPAILAADESMFLLLPIETCR